MQIVRNIRPVGVHCLNQVELPFPGIFLDALFPLDCVDQKIVFFKPDQCFHAIPGCKAGCQVVLVFIKPAGQVPGDAGVNRSIAFRRENVDVTFMRASWLTQAIFQDAPKLPLITALVAVIQQYRVCGAKRLLSRDGHRVAGLPGHAR
jgi:hypothetical protein